MKASESAAPTPFKTKVSTPTKQGLTGWAKVRSTLAQKNQRPVAVPPAEKPKVPDSGREISNWQKLRSSLGEGSQSPRHSIVHRQPSEKDRLYIEGRPSITSQQSRGSVLSRQPSRSPALNSSQPSISRHPTLTVPDTDAPSILTTVRLSSVTRPALFGDASDISLPAMPSSSSLALAPPIAAPPIAATPIPPQPPPLVLPPASTASHPPSRPGTPPTPSLPLPPAHPAPTHFPSIDLTSLYDHDLFLTTEISQKKLLLLSIKQDIATLSSEKQLYMTHETEISSVLTSLTSESLHLISALTAMGIPTGPYAERLLTLAETVSPATKEEVAISLANASQQQSQAGKKVGGKLLSRIGSVKGSETELVTKTGGLGSLAGSVVGSLASLNKSVK
ncbi:hypothetical protein HDV00_009975 [Rhizophlyctis rosea]|nr:hypothetical protein HDV00_009975 [Rhizophlyctis rosea]